jgi:hypothetical protein
MSKFIGRLLVVLALGWSGSVSAEVFRCVDEATGSVAFTDKDCPDKTAGEYIPVGKANGDGGYDKDAATKLSEKHAEQEAEFHRGWKEQNAQATRDEQNRKEAVERERRARGDQFEKSMNKKRYKKSASGHIYRDHTRD